MHTRAAQQHAVGGDKQTVHMKHRQGVQQHIPGGESPYLHQGPAIGGQVGMTQHDAFRPTGSPGGIQQGRQVAGGTGDRVELRGTGGGARHQAATAIGLQGQYPRHTGALREGDQQRCGRPPTDHHRRLRIIEEVLQFGGLVGRVQRVVDQPGSQAGQVEPQHLGAFLNLHGHPVTRSGSQCGEVIGDARRLPLRIGIGINPAVRCLQQHRRGIRGKPSLELLIEVIALRRSHCRGLEARR